MDYFLSAECAINLRETGQGLYNKGRGLGFQGLHNKGRGDRVSRFA